VVYIYQLPFGRGMKWGTNWNSVLNAVLGGWQTNGIWRFDTGQPIILGLQSGQPLPTYGGQRPNLNAPLQVRTSGTTDERLNAYFTNPEVATTPDRWTLGTAPRTLPNARVPGTNTALLSLFKEVPLSALREGAKIQFRVEAFNALNHPQFGCLNSTVGQGTFGKMTCQANSPREAQLALKLYW
jgi:hypothetical protein